MRMDLCCPIRKRSHVDGVPCHPNKASDSEPRKSRSCEGHCSSHCCEISKNQKLHFIFSLFEVGSNIQSFIVPQLGAATSGPHRHKATIDEKLVTRVSGKVDDGVCNSGCNVDFAPELDNAACSILI